MAFELHPRLAASGEEIAAFSGCRIIMKNEAQFPWLIIVPEVEEGIEDLHQLDVETYVKVTEVIRRVSEHVSSYVSCEKLNVACIGNVVRQMHIHVVGRSSSDPAWPGVVWAHPTKKKFSEENFAERVTAARAFFAKD